MLKTLFEFQDPSALVESFLGLSLEELLIIATNQMGSYATEAFLKSRTVPTERKHDLIKKLEVKIILVIRIKFLLVISAPAVEYQSSK